MFTTGIENSYPTIKLPDGSTKRVDEMEKTGHYKNWKTDFQLVKDLDICFLRYGPPYYKTHLAPGKYDWSFTDETFNKLKELEITPIVDLCHFGVPDWLGNFQNPDFPKYFAEYAKAFAERFPYLQFYTPVNEIFIAATFLRNMDGGMKSLQAIKRSLLHLNIYARQTCLPCIPYLLCSRMQLLYKVNPQNTFIQPNRQPKSLRTFLTKKDFFL